MHRLGDKASRNRMQEAAIGAEETRDETTTDREAEVG